MTMASGRAVLCGLLAVILWLLAPNTGRAQGEPVPSDAARRSQINTTSSPPAKYDPLEAGREAYQRAEAGRCAAIGRQLQILDNMAWCSGARGQRIPPSLESIYAYPQAWRTSQSAVQSEHPGTSPCREESQWATFEPWPLVPGDIFASPWLDRVQQPAGHEILATGPNSYLYRPVYATEAPRARPATKAREVTLPRPPEAHPPAISIAKENVPRPTIPPAPSANAPPTKEGGPRTF